MAIAYGLCEVFARFYRVESGSLGVLIARCVPLCHISVMNDERLMDLEIKVSFQEKQIEDLQKLVDEQYSVIEKMEKMMKVVTETIKSNDPSILTGHYKPPHY